MVCRLTIIFIVASSFVVAAPSLAQSKWDDQRSKNAETHYRNAQRAYKKREFEKARKEFLKAYDIVGDVELLYNVGLCYSALQNLKEARIVAERILSKPEVPVGLRVRTEARLRSLNTIERASAISDESPRREITVTEIGIEENETDLVDPWNFQLDAGIGTIVIPNASLRRDDFTRRGPTRMSAGFTAAIRVVLQPGFTVGFRFSHAGAGGTMLLNSPFSQEQMALERLRYTTFNLSLGWEFVFGDFRLRPAALIGVRVRRVEIDHSDYYNRFREPSTSLLTPLFIGLEGEVSYALFPAIHLLGGLILDLGRAEPVHQLNLGVRLHL